MQFCCFWFSLGVLFSCIFHYISLIVAKCSTEENPVLVHRNSGDMIHILKTLLFVDILDVCQIQNGTLLHFNPVPKIYLRTIAHPFTGLRFVVKHKLFFIPYLCLHRDYLHIYFYKYDYKYL